MFVAMFYNEMDLFKSFFVQLQDLAETYGSVEGTRDEMGRLMIHVLHIVARFELELAQ